MLLIINIHNEVYQHIIQLYTVILWKIILLNIASGIEAITEHHCLKVNIFLEMC